MMNVFYRFFVGATFIFVGSAFAQNALFVCTAPDGMQTIVPAEKKSANCVPYTKGMFAPQKTTSAPPKAVSPVPPTATKIALPEKNVPEQGIPASQLFRFIEQPKVQAGQSEKPAALNKNQIPETKTVEVEKEEKNQPKPVNLYICIHANGDEILEATEPPHEQCRFFAKKADAWQPKPKKTTSKPTTEKPSGKGEIAVTDSPPMDIYKCFDQDGRASYVAENQQAKFRRCSFFSRSFASAKARFKQQATQPRSLGDLAVQGVQNLNEPEPTATAAIRCTGAGKVHFNGVKREYECATRSYDFTLGSSGGVVVYGEQQATVAPYQNYLNVEGSCGGTVTSADGKIFHLEPTKDCPAALIVEARKIKAAYIKTLDIPVSGQFLERQRGLSAEINRIARTIGVDPFLVHAVISAESAYKPKAVSRAGAQGLMQLMPATARRFGVTDAFHTGENVRGGTTYLKWLLNEFNGNLELAVAGYNAGEGNVRKYGYKIPPFIETRAYVPKVMQYYRRYKSNPSLIGL